MQVAKEPIQAPDPPTEQTIDSSYQAPQIAQQAPVTSDYEAEAKSFIYMNESGNESCKINGGAVDCNYDGNRACGLGQSLPCQKLTAVCSLSDYNCQDIWFTNYMLNRYGSWANAKAFWLSHKWW
jgi:hypothetical protein